MKSPQKICHTGDLLIFLFILFVIPILLPSLAFCDHSLLKSIIIDYNKQVIEKSIQDGSYRGEEGVLRIRPEIGESMGMTVLMDADYLEAKRLFGTAEDSLKRAKEILAARDFASSIEIVNNATNECRQNCLVTIELKIGQK